MQSINLFPAKKNNGMYNQDSVISIFISISKVFDNPLFKKAGKI